MKKTITIIIIVVILGFTSAYLIYRNYDGLSEYLNNEDWKITESIGSVSLNNYYAIDGTSSNIVIIGNNYIKGYSTNIKESFDEIVSLKSAISDSNGDYCIVGEKDGTKIYMINSNAKIWESEIQGNILGLTVNKNGYSAIIYKQTGYKSLIKVLKPDGTELFTNYLASTYAIDVEISNDNKMLAIAEIDADGIKAQSSLKIININNIAKEEVQRIALEDEIIVDIEYTSKNELLVQTNNNIKIVNNDGINEFISLNSNDILYASIENGNNALTISKVENGLFSKSYLLSIYEYDANEIKTKQYQLEKSPSMITAANKNVGMLVESEFLVVNTNGHLEKKFNVSGNIQSIVFFDNGNHVALIFRDKIEFIKV